MTGDTFALILLALGLIAALIRAWLTVDRMADPR